MNNFDVSELKKFSELAQQWWDLSGPCAPLHAINPLRLSFIKEQVQLTNKHILDVGCGGGILTEALARDSENVTGIDLNNELIETAKLHQHKSKLNISYQTIAVEEFATQNAEKFDIVTCMELLEHVPRPQSIVKACVQLTRSKGYVFFSTLNRNIKSYLKAIIGAEYLLHLIPKGTHNYSKFIKPSELDSWCREHQLNLIKLIGVDYNPITKNYSLSEDISVNYIACFQKDAF